MAHCHFTITSSRRLLCPHAIPYSQTSICIALTRSCSDMKEERDDIRLN